jgi:hypothetical protein
MMSSINYCCSASSGTMAYDRSVRHYRYALSAEMDAWRSGQRDPRFISDVWTARCHTDKVAQAVVNLAQT